MLEEIEHDGSAMSVKADKLTQAEIRRIFAQGKNREEQRHT